MLPNFLKYKGNMFLSFHVYLHLVIPMRAIVIMIGARCCFTTQSLCHHRQIRCPLTCRCKDLASVYRKCSEPPLVVVIRSGYPVQDVGFFMVGNENQGSSGRCDVHLQLCSYDYLWFLYFGLYMMMYVLFSKLTMQGLY